MDIVQVAPSRVSASAEAIGRNLLAIGYREGIAPELAALARAYSYVFTDDVAARCSVTCILDPSRPAEMQVDALEIRRSLQSVSGERSFTFTFIEVHEGAPASDDLERMRQDRSSLSEVDTDFWWIDVQNHRGFNNGEAAPFSHAELPASIRGGLDSSFTLTMMPLRPPSSRAANVLAVLLVAVYAAECVFSGLVMKTSWFTPTNEVLFLMGSVYRPVMVDYGQWWRLLTGPLLHASLLHLGSNLMGLLVLAPMVQATSSRKAVPILIAAGAVTGAVGSVLAPPLLSVGISGGLLALLVFVLIELQRRPANPRTSMFKMQLWLMAAFALVPLPVSILGVSIDHAAHWGGALAGVALWPLLRQPKPNRNKAEDAFVPG